LLEVFDAVRVLGDASFFQKAFELEAPHAEELSGLIVREGTGTVALYGESLEGFAGWVLVLRQVIRERNRDFHGSTIAFWRKKK
jgi:hypothetical protein